MNFGGIFLRKSRPKIAPKPLFLVVSAIHSYSNFAIFRIEGGNVLPVENQRKCALLRSVEMSHLTQKPVETIPRI
jgi:hypothetical protein